MTSKLDRVLLRMHGLAALPAVFLLGGCGDSTEPEVVVAVAAIRLSAPPPNVGHLSLDVGQMAQLLAEPMSVTGSPLSPDSVQWSSSHTSVAMVDRNGLVSAVSDGVTLIRAALGDVTAWIPVVVGASMVPVVEDLESLGDVFPPVRELDFGPIVFRGDCGAGLQVGNYYGFVGSAQMGRILSVSGTPGCLQSFSIHFPRGAALVSWRYYAFSSFSSGGQDGVLVGRYHFYFRDGRQRTFEEYTQAGVRILDFDAWDEPGFVDSVRVTQMGFDGQGGVFDDFRFLSGVP